METSREAGLQPRVLWDRTGPPSKILPGFSPRLTLIQMGTIAPRQSLGFKKRWESAGGEYLEAPVLGSIPQAWQGKLVVMVGSTKDQYEHWLPVLERFSPEPLYIGPVGKAAGLETAALEGVREVVEKALARGLADADYSSIYEAVDPAG